MRADSLCQWPWSSATEKPLEKSPGVVCDSFPPGRWAAEVASFRLWRKKGKLALKACRERWLSDPQPLHCLSLSHQEATCRCKASRGGTLACEESGKERKSPFPPYKAVQRIHLSKAKGVRISSHDKTLKSQPPNGWGESLTLTTSTKTETKKEPTVAMHRSQFLPVFFFFQFWVNWE